MSASTLATVPPGNVFNFGDILNRVANTSIDIFQKVAPPWLEQQLNINEKIPVASDPTYQNTDSQRQPAQGLTTNEGTRVNNTTFTVNQSTVLLIGVAALAALLFIREA